MSIIDKINSLSAERQALWSICGRQLATGQRRPTVAEYDRIQWLNSAIKKLWKLRREELSGGNRR